MSQWAELGRTRLYTLRERRRRLAAVLLALGGALCSAWVAAALVSWVSGHGWVFPSIGVRPIVTGGGGLLGLPHLGEPPPAPRRPWADWEQRIRVVARPGWGKTSRLLVPIIRALPGPALVSSTEPGIFTQTVTARRFRAPAPRWRWTSMLLRPWLPLVEYPVVVVDFSAPQERYAAGYPRVHWSPVPGCAALGGKDVDDLLEWLRKTDDPTPGRILRDAREADPSAAVNLRKHLDPVAGKTTSGVERYLTLSMNSLAAAQRKFGIGYVYAVQSTTQEDAVYSADAPALRAVAGVSIYGGIDIDSARELSEWAGVTPVVTATRGDRRTEQIQLQETLTIGDQQQLADGQATVVVRGLAPFLAWVPSIYEQRSVNRRIRQEAEQVAQRVAAARQRELATGRSHAAAAAAGADFGGGRG